MVQAGYNQRINYMTEMFEVTAGVPGLFPRYSVPQPTQYFHQPTTFNNIQVDRSVVGAINTGDVAAIDAAIDRASIGGDNELKEALTEFAQKVVGDLHSDAELRNQLLEQLSFLATQLSLPKPQQKRQLAKAVAGAIKETAGTIAGLALAWQKLEPLVSSYFGWK